MPDQMIREESVSADGRRLVFYRQKHRAVTARPDATVVSGSTVLASEIASVLQNMGITVLRISRNPESSRGPQVYYGTVGMPEIWESIMNRYTVQTVIHTAALDPLDPSHPADVFSNIVGEGAAMAHFLAECAQPVRVIAASHSTAVCAPETSEYPLSVYGENLRQLEQQWPLFMGRNLTRVVILRVGTILVPQGPSLTDLWGERVAPGGPDMDCVLLDDAVQAFIHACERDGSPAIFWAANIASGQTFSLQGGAMPQDRGAWPPPGTLEKAQEVLHWRADRERVRRAVQALMAGEGVSR